MLCFGTRTGLLVAAAVIVTVAAGGLADTGPAPNQPGGQQTSPPPEVQSAPETPRELEERRKRSQAIEEELLRKWREKNEETIRKLREKMETERRETVRREEHRPLERLLYRWFYSLSRRARSDQNRVEHLEDNLLYSFYQAWTDKVFSLKEFFGEKTEAELDFSPLEKGLLNALRTDRTRLACFTREDLPIEERMDLCQKDLAEPRHAEVVKKLQQWLDHAYEEQITPERERAERLRVRAGYMLDFLVDDIRRANSLPARGGPTGKMMNLAVGTVKKINQTGAFMELPPADDKRLETLSVTERALYAYLRAAAAKNPVLKDLDRNFVLQDLFEAYRAYVASKRPEAEKRAYVLAVKAIADYVGQSLSVP